MGVTGLDLSFLEDIKLNEPPTKSVRFNDNEKYMLKFIAYTGRKFSGYVKELIINDMRNYCNKDSKVNSISKEDIKDIVLEALEENNFTCSREEKEVENKKIDNEDLGALAELGITKR